VGTGIHTRTTTTTTLQIFLCLEPHDTIQLDIMSKRLFCHSQQKCRWYVASVFWLKTREILIKTKRTHMCKEYAHTLVFPHSPPFPLIHTCTTTEMYTGTQRIPSSSQAFLQASHTDTHAHTRTRTHTHICCKHIWVASNVLAQPLAKHLRTINPTHVSADPTHPPSLCSAPPLASPFPWTA